MKTAPAPDPTPTQAGGPGAVSPAAASAPGPGPNETHGPGFELYDLRVEVVGPADKPIYWMTSDAEVACPDPNCPTRFRISRTGRRYFQRSDVTAVPLPTQDPK